MTKLDWFMLVVALLLTGVTSLVIIQSVAPKDDITISPECDYVPQVWLIHACNGLNVCDDNYVRMTVEEANGVCR